MGRATILLTPAVALAAAAGMFLRGDAAAERLFRLALGGGAGGLLVAAALVGPMKLCPSSRAAASGRGRAATAAVGAAAAFRRRVEPVLRAVHVAAGIGCLPLAERNLTLGRSRRRWLPVAILAGAMALVTIGLVPVQIGFFLAAVLVILFRSIPPREAYDAVDWPIIVMLACLIPVGESVRETGAAGLIADWLSSAAVHLPGQLAVGLMLVVSMLVTPLMHHAAAVLVMGPIAAAVAKNLGFSADPFLMAVALGASCDFLTPIGHQNNLLVMGPGGYRFGDYWRLGLPLTIMVAIFGTSLIIMAWPLR